MSPYRWFRVPEDALDHIWLARREVGMHVDTPWRCADCPPDDSEVCARFRRALRVLINRGLSPYSAPYHPADAL
ncbi:hypothetical protein O7635_05390 [Asanoa sp. WMMD1127]|uniref:hypothetical protein n=1 Tax=Asanoa sp. WMMD1127 TaxID=3016107 RepID=UPI0024171C97|nr:hypothetical protein [Asanoa sp. WMMD1127]MDG4821286.1 hypothetical protein [Asanoa sp. WMMD1127]